MAGGAGTRLRPLTNSTPKPLLPVVGRTLLEHQLILLRRHGITEAVLTVFHLAAAVRSYLGDGSELGMDLTYATEAKPLGTAGSVKLAEERLQDEDFLVISGDGLTDFDLGALIDFHKERGALVTICLARRSDPVEFGLVVTDEDGRITRFLEKPTWGQVFTDTVNTGIYVVSPEVLARIPADEDVDWSNDVFPALLAEGAPLFGYVAEGYWEDVGTVAAYRRAQRDALDGRVHLDVPGIEVSPGVWLGAGVEVSPDAQVVGPVFLGDSSRVRSGARIGPYAVLGRHAVVSAGAVVEQAVLMDNVAVGTGAELRGCVVGRDSDLLARVRVDEGSSIGDSCRLEKESVVTAGADIYPHKTVGAGEIVTETVVWDVQSPRQMFAGEEFSGTVNIDVTPEVVARVAGALATTLPKGAPMAVARDHSRAAEALSLVLAGALAAAGLNVDILEGCPVPVARAHVRARCSGGMIARTAPGRPDELELMFLAEDGGDVAPRVRQQLERILNRHDTRRPPSDELGLLHAPVGVVSEYVDAVLANTDLSGIAEAGMRVVVDTAGGLCSTVLPALMAAVDVEVLAVNSRLTPDHPTETAEEREAALTRLGQLVTSSIAALGVRIDPAGERISIVDETGRVLSDDRALLVVLDLIAAERRTGVVGLPATTTRVAAEVTRFHGVEVVWTPTGSQALSSASSRDGMILAGDAEGGFVIPAVGRSADAMAALVQILGLVARTKLTMRQIDTRIPNTTLLRSQVPTPWSRKGAVMREVRKAAQGEHVDETEGVRVVLPGGAWVLVSPDAGEAAVRIWVESPDEDEAKELLSAWGALVAAAARVHDDDESG